eukprot:scaffold2061_cov246-Pinguiococcus_pyrenoidosus.AAC.8
MKLPIPPREAFISSSASAGGGVHPSCHQCDPAERHWQRFHAEVPCQLSDALLLYSPDGPGGVASAGELDLWDQASLDVVFKTGQPKAFLFTQEDADSARSWLTPIARRLLGRALVLFARQEKAEHAMEVFGLAIPDDLPALALHDTRRDTRSILLKGNRTALQGGVESLKVVELLEEAVRDIEAERRLILSQEVPISGAAV